MTQLAGILNLTPDSFSSDGLVHVEAALERMDVMIAQGAHIIDIGAESTRPGATSLSAEAEWRRLEPVLARLGERPGKVRFSIDTRHASVAERALALGCNLVNDVSGLAEPAMLPLLKKQGCDLIAMHSVTVPASVRHGLPPDADAVQAVGAWAQGLLARAEAQGISRRRVIIDPGIGFGKSREQSLQLIKEIGRFKALGAPLMVGHSRKSFLSLVTGRPASARDPETLAVSCYLVGQGVDWLRVHDIESHAALLRIHAALA